MNFRLTFIIVLLLITTIVGASTAYADAVTTSYAENREMMIWRFNCDDLTTCVGSPANQIAWNSMVEPLPTSLLITSRHLVGPQLTDIGVGAKVSFIVPFDRLNALPPQGVLTIRGVVPHPIFPHEDADLYDLFIRRNPNENEGFQFILASQHVPEPATLLLLSTGLGGAAIKMRNRLKSRKGG